MRAGHLGDYLVQSMTLSGRKLRLRVEKGLTRGPGASESDDDDNKNHDSISVIVYEGLFCINFLNLLHVRQRASLSLFFQGVRKLRQRGHETGARISAQAQPVTAPLRFRASFLGRRGCACVLSHCSHVKLWEAPMDH